jgi:hypothetical protein
MIRKGRSPIVPQVKATVHRAVEATSRSFLPNRAMNGDR